MKTNTNTEELITKIANKFLGWQLPSDFRPDGGISYKQINNYQPVGTNLLTEAQAIEMFNAVGKELIDQYVHQKVNKAKVKGYRIGYKDGLIRVAPKVDGDIERYKIGKGDLDMSAELQASLGMEKTNE